jgi:hypothetical protein
MFDIDFSEIRECPEEYEKVLVELSNTLTVDDVAFILAEIMRNNNQHIVESKAYDKSTGKDLLHFRMRAEFGYYLDDEVEDEEED